MVTRSVSKIAGMVVDGVDQSAAPVESVTADPSGSTPQSLVENPGRIPVGFSAYRPPCDRAHTA